MTGDKFGKLIVLSECIIKHRKYYKCKCDCGNIKYIRSDMLKSGHTKSCGCLNKKHGKRHTKLYKVYHSIKDRCYNNNDKNYPNYGKRGILMCDEWLSDFMNFYNWAMKNGYKEGLTIDRIDNDKGYSPYNCRWVDRKIQANNRRSNTYLTCNGKTQTITQWADELHINRATISMRKRKYGYSDKECLFGKE